MAGEFISAGQVRDEMYRRSDRFFGAVRSLMSGTAEVYQVTADNASNKPVTNILINFEQQAIPGAHWAISIPKALAERAKVNSLTGDDPRMQLDYGPGTIIEATTLRASLSTTKPNSLVFLGEPNVAGQRLTLQFGVDGPRALSEAVLQIHPQVILPPGRFE